MRIVLTGGVASGKTTASDAFGALGAPIVDADVLAREVVAPGTPGLDALVEGFGEGILATDGTLDRAALRRILFDDAEAKRSVESILHPRIRALGDERAAAALDAGHPYVLHVIPLLVETGQAERFDRVLVIDLPVDMQRRRLVARDGIDAATAARMLAAQATRDARLAVADDVIENSGDRTALVEAVEQLHARYVALAVNARAVGDDATPKGSGDIDAGDAMPAQPD